MLRHCTKEEFEQNIDFAYALAMDLSRSGYPTYADGVKTKEQFVERCMKAFSRDTEEMLAFEKDGELLGFIQIYWISEDQYLATNICNIKAHTGEALAELLSYVSPRFSGYNLYLGFPEENEEAVKYLSEHGFERIEESFNNTVFMDRCSGEFCDGMVRITKENYGLFRELHQKMDDEMYWNSDRILADLEHWSVFVKMEGEAPVGEDLAGKMPASEALAGEMSAGQTPVGAVYLEDARDDWFEIFGIDLKDDRFREDLFCDLLSTAIAEAKALGGRVMTFFCETEEEEKAAQKAGFSSVGKYVCYMKEVK